MEQPKRLAKYLKSKLIKFEIFDEKYLVLGEDDDEKEFLIVSESAMIMDENMIFLPISDTEVDGFVYSFCGRFYLQDYEEEQAQMIELINYGKAVQNLPIKSFLGIHSGYELLNGSGSYSNWIKKAKFLGAETLGICEKHTLSGALVFQNECQQNGIKSIIGMTIQINGKELFDIKAYAINFQGWLNLLKFNSKINVDKETSIELEYLIANRLGLYIVADPKEMNFNEVELFENHIDFYQLDTTVFLNEDKDIWFINNMEKFLGSDLKPISINDAYYLEKEDYVARETLWKIGKIFGDRADNQYFKNSDQYAKELISMFDSKDKGWISLYKEAVVNENILVDSCNFIYDTGTRHLPAYEMSEEESKNHNTNEELFIHLCTKGLKNKGLSNESKYIQRLKDEIVILKRGDVIDYFLILNDIVNYAVSQEMLTGIGRGSAGGSLVAYLLGIIHVDPLEFDLLFERFLNSGRMGYFEDRPNFIYEGKDGESVELAEGELARVIRNNKERVVYCEDVKVGDRIIKF
jgi:DNA polymerase-3 subunit alpha